MHRMMHRIDRNFRHVVVVWFGCHVHGDHGPVSIVDSDRLLVHSRRRIFRLRCSWYTRPRVNLRRFRDHVLVAVSHRFTRGRTAVDKIAIGQCNECALYRNEQHI